MFINQSEEGSAYVGGDRHVEGRVEPHDVSGSGLPLLARNIPCMTAEQKILQSSLFKAVLVSSGTNN